MRTELALLLVLIPAQAAEPLREPDVACNAEWCLIRKATFNELLLGVQKMNAHIEELRGLCGWGR